LKQFSGKRQKNFLLGGRGTFGLGVIWISEDGSEAIIATVSGQRLVCVGLPGESPGDPRRGDADLSSASGEGPSNAVLASLLDYL